MSNDSNVGVFSLSLKQLMGLMIFFGPGLGMLGHIYNEYPQYFQPALIIFFATIPFLLAVLTILRVGFKQEQRRLILWGIIILCMPLFGGVAFWLVPISKNGIDHLSTKNIIEKQIPKRWDNSAVWRELNRRIDKGRVSEKQANQAFDTLLGVFESMSSSNSIHFLSDILTFQGKAEAANLLPENSIASLCDSTYGQIGGVHLLNKIRVGEVSAKCLYNATYRHYIYDKGYPLPIWHIEKVLVDNQPIKFILENNDRNNGIGLGNQSSLVFQPSDFSFSSKQLTAGTHSLTVHARFAYVEPDCIGGLNVGSLDKKLWPKTIVEWDRTVKKNFRVLETDKPFVKLVTSSKYDPLKNNQFKVSRAILQRGENDKSSLLLEVDCPTLDDVTYSFKIYAVLDNDKKLVGTYRSQRKVQRWWYHVDSISYPSFIVKTLYTTPSDKTVTVDLLLEPDLDESYQRQGNVKAIWNKSIWIRDVPVDRRDLDSADK